MKPAEAQRIHGHKDWRHAILTRDIAGKFSKWKKGEKVRVLRAPGIGYSIERDKWSGSLVPLCNMLSGVPRSAFAFVGKPKSNQ